MKKNSTWEVGSMLWVDMMTMDCRHDLGVMACFHEFSLSGGMLTRNEDWRRYLGCSKECRQLEMGEKG